MGSPYLGMVANLALARKEKTVIKSDKILAYIRYIANVYLEFQGSSEDLDAFLRDLDRVIHSLKINWKRSKTHAIYLDAEVWIHPARVVRPYHKPMNQHALLPWSSAHPIHTKKGLVIGESTRISLLCSEESLFFEERAILKANLLARGYPEAALTTWMNRVKWHNRFGILAGNSTASRSDDSVLRIPTRYDPLWEHINLRKVFDEAKNTWRRVWTENRPSGISLSQKHTKNIFDLLSAWNKTAYGEYLDNYPHGF